jgi:2-amino-4-hydroxy-6-hydroxymethyldihydropteridine diphosphokinase
MTRAYIGLGSNLEHPETQLTNALQALAALPSTALVTCSSFYRSQPLGPQDQPFFLNAVALLETTLAPLDLLDKMLAIERRQGRIRDGRRWRARTLDLDLLLYGAQRLEQHRLVVPHPEIPRRNFVLCPLAEITHDLHIPGMGRVADLLAEVGMDGLEKLSKNE